MVYARSFAFGVGGLSRILRSVTTVLVAVASVTLSTAAPSQALTQLEYLKWLVEVSGETDKFSENSHPTDYVMWARAKGMNPKGGWKLSEPVERQAFAETLAQFLRLNPSTPEASAQSLLSVGITVPANQVISRKDVVQLLNGSDQKFVTELKRPKSPNKPDRDRDKDKDRDRDNRPPPHPRDVDRGR